MGAGAFTATTPVTKTDSGEWRTASFMLQDAALADRLPGGKGHPGSDLRIDSLGDGDEIVHLVLVQGDERPLPPGGGEGPGLVPTPTRVVPALTPGLRDGKNTPTPVPGPWPPPNSVSAYGSSE